MIAINDKKGLLQNYMRWDNIQTVGWGMCGGSARWKMGSS